MSPPSPILLTFSHLFSSLPHLLLDAYGEGQILRQPGREALLPRGTESQGAGRCD